jgi:hypothetical protein
MGSGRRAKPSWLALTAYRLLVRLYPREFRARYGPDIEKVFQDMIQDQEIPTLLVWLSVSRDLPHSLIHEHLVNLRGGRIVMRGIRAPEPGSAIAGLVVGLGIMLFWLDGRGFHLGRLAEGTPWAANALLLLPCAMFVLAGFIGTRRTRNFIDGVWAGGIAAVVSLLIIPGDSLVFHRSVGSLGAGVVIVMTTGALALLFIGMGALLAGRTARRAAL